jgi:murein DD-endopeptidase MepM/ murein hydrolase activator NlpD
VVWVLVLAGCEGSGDCDDPPVDCSIFSSATALPYVLPWHIGHTHAANPHLIWDPTAQRYAIDVRMPIGTEILAMRAGTVVRLNESYFDGDNTPGHENYLLVQHDDGTVARYVHLTNGGALVNLGDVVQKSQHIAISGNTGNSSEPHLHFDVTRSCCAAPPDGNALPAGETLPMSFANATPDSSCGLKEGVGYTAMP